MYHTCGCHECYAIYILGLFTIQTVHSKLNYLAQQRNKVITTLAHMRSYLELHGEGKAACRNMQNDQEFYATINEMVNDSLFANTLVVLH